MPARFGVPGRLGGVLGKTEAVKWFSVRCLFELQPGLYEERVTLWQAEDFDAAIALAESEAHDYAGDVDATYLGLAQAYRLDEEPGQGAEAFSLVRESELPPSDYLTQFFDTGNERQRDVDE